LCAHASHTWLRAVSFRGECGLGEGDKADRAGVAAGGFAMRAGRGRAGMTLVVLLTVIAVIGELAALGWAGAGEARASADRAQCQSRLRALGAAGLMLIADQRGEMPDAMYWWKLPQSVDRGSVLPYLDYREGMEIEATDSPMACPSLLKIMGPNSQWNRTYS